MASSTAVVLDLQAPNRAPNWAPNQAQNWAPNRAPNRAPNWTPNWAPNKRRVSSLTDIKRGDQIARDRGPYQHHAIVVDVLPEVGKLELVHFTGSWMRKKKASIKHEVIEWKNVVKDRVYIIDHQLDILDVDEVVRRAKMAAYGSDQGFGNEDFNFMTNNCEHFATWCKTGEKMCWQVISKFLDCMNLGVEGCKTVAEAAFASSVRLF